MSLWQFEVVIILYYMAIHSNPFTSSRWTCRISHWYKMMPFRLIKLVMSLAHGSGISTACYPFPASVHRSLSSDDERLKLCLRVQTPVPVLGWLHSTISGISSISWVCWWRCTQEGGLLPQPQPLPINAPL